MDQSSAPTFAIVLKSVPADPEAQSAFSSAFTDAFHLAPEIGQEILEHVPVVIFSELKRGQVSDVKDPLKSLSEEHNAQFFITSSPVSALPELHWPESPDFDTVDADRVFSDVELHVRDEAVVCPECAHILVLDQSGDRVTATKLTNLRASDDAGEEHEGAVDEADLEEELQDELEDVDDSDEGLEQEIEDELEDLLDDTDVSESHDSSSPSTAEDDGPETPTMEGPDEDGDTDETTTSSTVESSSDESPETATGEANVFLSGVPDASTDEIVELLTDVRDCSVSEAEKLMDRPITPIKNGVSPEEAEQLKERFNEIGVTVNIVHK